MWNRRSPPLIKSTTRYLHDCCQSDASSVAGEDFVPHVFNVLETVSQVANERMVHVLEHPALSYDVPHTFGSYDYYHGPDISMEKHCTKVVHRIWVGRRVEAGGAVRRCVPSSFRMYFRAKDKLVSFLSTMRTLPKAPRPTTRSRRKWLRLTKWREG